MDDLTERELSITLLFVKIYRSILYRGLTISKSTLYRNNFELYNITDLVDRILHGFSLLQ